MEEGVKMMITDPRFLAILQDPDAFVQAMTTGMAQNRDKDIFEILSNMASGIQVQEHSGQPLSDKVHEFLTRTSKRMIFDCFIMNPEIWDYQEHSRTYEAEITIKFKIDPGDPKTLDFLQQYHTLCQVGGEVRPLHSAYDNIFVGDREILKDQLPALSARSRMEYENRIKKNLNV
jgi:hypothetical protein